MIGQEKNDLMSDINVTPFVDVMLVLLIIFMVTAPMMVQGVSVSLPEVETGALQSEEENLVLVVKADGRIFINDFPVSLENLREKLHAILADRSGRNVFLRADKDVAYGTVARVMSQAQAAGIEKLGMVTMPPSQDDSRPDKKENGKS